MDSITQATLGAAVAEALIGKKIGYKAAIIGAIGGTIPDLDVLLLPFYDELQRITIHRGYSHSILFSIFGAFLFAYLLSKIKWTKEIAFGKLYLIAFLVLITHILLDCFTTYGTQLFLPISDYRVGFDSISIIDPVYTMPLLLALILHWYYRKNKLNYKGWFVNAGLVVSTAYLIFTLYNKHQFEKEFVMQLQENNIEHVKLLSVPVYAGNLKWYGVAKDKTHLHLGKYTILSKNKINFHTFPINDHLLSDIDPFLVDRMKWFSQGFYTVAKNEGVIRLYNMQCDMQGVRTFGNYKAPTAFYFEIRPSTDDTYSLSSGMHNRN